MASVVLADIAEYHSDVVSSLKLYFSFGRRPNESSQELIGRLEETDVRSSFAVLSRLEAAFRIDYECRCKEKLKDDVSWTFRRMYKSRKMRVSLEDDIFEAWLQNSTGSNRLISELRGAFKFRHWLAHGKYWRPNLGRKYDFSYVYLLAENALNTLPLINPS